MMIYPVPGRIIHDPVTRRLVKARGMRVSADDAFWIRALESGDVSKAPPVEKQEGDVGDPPGEEVAAETAASEADKEGGE